MSNPAQVITRDDYVCRCMDFFDPNKVMAKTWQPCKCHVGGKPRCTECGHEVDCHETVRVEL